MTRTRVVTGFFQSNWSLQSTERLGHLQQLLTMNSGATAGVVGSLSGGLQSLLMMAALLGVALAVDPAAAIGVIVIGFVLLQILRPLNLRSKRANRELSKTTRAMATRVTEYTRLSRDFRLFGVETRVMDTLRGLIQDTGHMYRRTRELGSIAPILYQSFALGIVIVGIVFLAGHGHAALAKDGVVLILVLRSVSYGSGRPELDPGPPRLSGHAGGPHVRPPSLRRRSNQSRRAACPSPSRWTSIPWSTPTTG